VPIRGGPPPSCMRDDAASTTRVRLSTAAVRYERPNALAKEDSAFRSF
jgi:hypothetical protein